MGKHAVTWPVALYTVRTTGSIFQADRMFLMSDFPTFNVYTKIMFIFKNSDGFCKESPWTHKFSIETLEIKRVIGCFYFCLTQNLSNQKFSYKFLPLWNPQAVKRRLKLKMQRCRFPANMFFVLFFQKLSFRGS